MATGYQTPPQGFVFQLDVNGNPIPQNFTDMAGGGGNANAPTPGDEGVRA